MDNTIKTGEGQESDNCQLSIASCPLKAIAFSPERSILLRSDTNRW